MGSQSRERAILTEFISLYRDLPCLWDIGSDLYKDRSQKQQAWDLLNEILKEVDPEANIAATKKRVEHMRTAFKREHKKVKESKQTGAGANDVRTPNLWYYNMLLPIFEKKIDHSRCEMDPLPIFEKKIDHSRCEMDPLSIDEESQPLGPTMKKVPNDRGLARKRQERIETAPKLLKTEDKKPNSFGVYVGEQLEELATFQRQVAEKLISEILFLAKIGNLNLDTKIETPSLFSSSSTPNHTRPSFSRHYTQASSSPHYIQPSSSPQYTQPSSSPHYNQPSPAFHIQTTESAEGIIELSPELYPVPTEENLIQPTSTIYEGTANSVLKELLIAKKPK